jgi:hypothetical protein
MGDLRHFLSESYHLADLFYIILLISRNLGRNSSVKVGDLFPTDS